jgi:hypothetical protein
VQVTQEGTTSVVVGTTTTLDSTLGSKQPAISVSTTNALPLLTGNVLASLGSSTTVSAEGGGRRGRRSPHRTSTAPEHEQRRGPAGRAGPEGACGGPELQLGRPASANCTSITGLTSANGSFKDAGLANALSYQLGFYAPGDGCTRVYTIAGHGDGDGWNRLGQYVDPNAGGSGDLLLQLVGHSSGTT